MKEYHFNTNEEEDLKTIESIPTLYLKFLIEVGPILERISSLIDVLEWKNPSKSTIAIIFWLVLCKWIHIWIVFGLPIWVVYHRIKYSLQGKQNDMKDGEQIKKIRILAALNNVKKIQIFWLNSNWKVIYDSMMIINTNYILYFYIWLFLNCWLRLNNIICTAGIWLMVSCSSWYNLVYFSIKSNVYLYYLAQAIIDYHIASYYYYLPAKNMKQISPITTIDDTSNSSKELYQCQVDQLIEIYEHERWWIGLKWTKDLLNSERKPWTDNLLKPIKSKQDYELPTNVVIHAPQQRTIKTWVWVDDDWHIDMLDSIDGWKYTDNKWQHGMNIPGPSLFTRQRKWCRRAKIIEKQIIYHY